MSSKLLYLIPVLLLAGCGAYGVLNIPETIQASDFLAPPQPQQVQASPVIVASKTPLPTLTPGPSATPTLNLQATIDFLVRQQSQITLDVLHMQNNAMDKTAVAEDANNLHLVWTATAAPTALRATETQGAFNNLVAVAQMTEKAAEKTAVAFQPTAMVAQADAVAYSDWAWLRQITEILTPFIILLIVLSLPVIVLLRMRHPAPQPVEPPEQTVEQIFVKKRSSIDRGLGSYLKAPGNQYHFMIFALAVRQGKKGFAKEEWETADSPYNRDTYRPVYNWLWQHGFLEMNPGKRIELTIEGADWIDEWIISNPLLSPDHESTQNEPPVSQPPENQPPETGGEVVADPESIPLP
jgi:hypothetical protein